ncbi:hypothetical protein MTR_5g069150 [Medicago truncatula]|uniref:Uncharacterized protein n=1 Tax=Medicago truncatula TaxID=3880 RepID=G7KDZ5_MEDTR|nr:hypothetical protein MTR_5g069150 [Medicago truncatula]
MSVRGGAASMKAWAYFLEPLMNSRHRCKAKMHHTWIYGTISCDLPNTIIERDSTTELA